jgi:hypothetical protein
MDPTRTVSWTDLSASEFRGAAKLERVPRANYMRLMRRLGVIRADARHYGEDEPETVLSV